MLKIMPAYIIGLGLRYHTQKFSRDVSFAVFMEIHENLILENFLKTNNLGNKNCKILINCNFLQVQYYIDTFMASFNLLLSSFIRLAKL